jgi:hypothetical protein
MHLSARICQGCEEPFVIESMMIDEDVSLCPGCSGVIGQRIEQRTEETEQKGELDMATPKDNLDDDLDLDLDLIDENDLIEDEDDDLIEDENDDDDDDDDD